MPWATAVCTIHLAEVCCIDDGIKEVVKGDVWFDWLVGSQQFFKSNRSWSFPKKFIKEVLCDALGGIHSVLKDKAPNGVPFVALG